MTLSALRSFDLIVKRGSFSNAATELQVAPSALSRAMTQLQREVGRPLFERVGRKTVLTAFGTTFLAHVRIALDEIDTGLREADLAAGIPTLALGFMHSLGADMVPRFIGDFILERPETRLRLRQGATQAMLEDQLVSGEIELAIMIAPQLPKKFTSVRLVREPYVAIVPAAHPLAARKTIELVELAHDPFIVMKPEFVQRGVTDTMFEDAGIAPAIVCEVEEIDTMRGLVSCGVGVGLIPGFARRYADEPARLELTRPRTTADLLLISLSARRLSSAADAFRKHLRRHYQASSRHE